MQLNIGNSNARGLDLDIYNTNLGDWMNVYYENAVIATPTTYDLCDSSDHHQTMLTTAQGGWVS